MAKQPNPCSSENLLRLPGVRAITKGWRKLSGTEQLRLAQLLMARCEMTGLRIRPDRKKVQSNFRQRDTQRTVGSF